MIVAPLVPAVARSAARAVRQAGSSLGARPPMNSPLHITPFSIRIEAEILSDLRTRIRNTRWPDQAPGTAWEQGTDLDVP